MFYSAISVCWIRLILYFGQHTQASDIGWKMNLAGPCRGHILSGFFPTVPHFVSKGMAEKCTSALKPRLVGIFKWTWWIAFALGYVQCSVMFVVIAERWISVIIAMTLRVKIWWSDWKIWGYASCIRLPLDKRKEHQKVYMDWYCFT